MRNSKNKIKIILSVIVLIVITTTAFYPKNNTVIENKTIIRMKNSNMISLMLETEVNSGTYEVSTNNKWPQEGYIFNENLSKCENGSKLAWNESDNSVSLRANISDKCFIYFDIEPPDISVAITNKPQIVGSQATLMCTGAICTYNQKYNRIEVSQVSTKYVDATLNYTNRTSKTYLNNKIISLVGTTQGTGQVVNENGYRYEGKNPNNWVWFNNELWRIIGVFDSTTHGVSSTNLIKIIRANPIGSLLWDKTPTNDWPNASLKKLLNDAYYNKKKDNEAYCYSYSNIQGNCDYSNIGIDANYRGMIREVTWKLGGHTTQAATASTFYTAERGSATGNNNAYAKEIIGHIGLMYPSDYGYSVLANSCARTVNLNAYNTSACSGQSWLGGKGTEWLLSPVSSNSVSVFDVYTAGRLNYTGASATGFIIRPTLYLDSSVYVIDGIGSEVNPYIIGM